MKKLLIATILGASALMLTVFVGSKADTRSLAETKSFLLHLDDSSRIKEGSLKTAFGNKIEFHADGLGVENGFWHTLSGSLSNVSPINGLRSFVAEFEGDLQISYGYKNDEGKIRYIVQDDLVSNVAYAFDDYHPSYIQLVGNEAKITSLDLSYSCVDENAILRDIGKELAIDLTLIDEELYFGLYPQSVVTSVSLINSLSQIAAPKKNGYYFYGGKYYAKATASPYASTYTFDNGQTILGANEYWFNVEPIHWRCLQDGNRPFLLSEDVLCAHRFDGTSWTKSVDGKSVYGSNWEYSEIRGFLNGEFYASAFALNGDDVVTSIVANDSTTTYGSGGNSYGPTNDKVFLPSYADYLNANYGFSTSSLTSSSTRRCKITEYARATGVQGTSSSGDAFYTGGYYWTRSYSVSDVWCISFGGAVTKQYGTPTRKQHGVRPCLYVDTPFFKAQSFEK